MVIRGRGTTSLKGRKGKNKKKAIKGRRQVAQKCCSELEKNVLSVQSREFRKEAALDVRQTWVEQKKSQKS